MDGFRAYKIYIALKLHYTTDKFDVFTNPNVKGTRESFSARNDRYLFDKLARKFGTERDLIQYLTANFAYGNDAAVYNGYEAQDNYVIWQRRKQSMTKTISDDLDTITLFCEQTKCKFDDLFNTSDFPGLLKLYLGNQVCIETMAVIDDYHSYINSWIQDLNLIFKEDCRRIVKVKKFVKYDDGRASILFSNFLKELSGS